MLLNFDIVDNIVNLTLVNKEKTIYINYGNFSIDIYDCLQYDPSIFEINYNNKILYINNAKNYIDICIYNGYQYDDLFSVNLEKENIQYIIKKIQQIFINIYKKDINKYLEFKNSLDLVELEQLENFEIENISSSSNIDFSFSIEEETEIIYLIIIYEITYICIPFEMQNINDINNFLDKKRQNIIIDDENCIILIDNNEINILYHNTDVKIKIILEYNIIIKYLNEVKKTLIELFKNNYL